MLLFLIPISSLVMTGAVAGPYCQEHKPMTGCWPRLLNRDLNYIANRVLLGHGYRNLTVASRALCSRVCLIEACCHSFHYSEGERRCELNGATALRFPLALTNMTGTLYCGPEEPTFDKMLATWGAEVPLSQTDNWYQTRASASSECQSAGQHLCLQWELQHAYKEGYPATTPYGSWCADPDSLAVLTETGVTFHDLLLTVTAPALCCSLPLSYRHPFLTREGYDLTDRAAQMSGCSDQAAHLCTLVELKEAYDHGYRCVECWFYFATSNRDASVPPGGCSSYHYGSECYQGVIPNTPRPYSRAPAYCCPNRA